MSEGFEKVIDEIKARYQAEIDEIQTEGERLGEEAPDPNAVEAVINVDFDLKWEDRQFSLDVPTAKMVVKKISFDVPEIIKKSQKISFDVPVTKMETYCAFKRPVVRWPKVEMECVYLDKPVVRMETKEIVFDLPEVKMTTKEISFSVPEFSMERLDVSLKLPVIIVKNISVETKKLEDRADGLKTRGEEIARKMQGEIQSAINAYFGAGTAEQSSVRHSVEQQFDGAIAELSNSITKLQAEGVDPVKVPANGGNINVRKILAEVSAQKQKVISQIDAIK